MLYALLAGLLALGVFIGMVILQEIGDASDSGAWRVIPRARGRASGRSMARVRPAGSSRRVHVLGAASRFDARRQLVVEEANAIGTAYLRLDVLPHEAQPAPPGQVPPVRRGAARRLSQAPGHRGGEGGAGPGHGMLQGDDLGRGGRRPPGPRAPKPAAVLLTSPALNAMIRHHDHGAPWRPSMHPPAIDLRDAHHCWR
jgi:hypothetical protein